jgi:hypothetical protein
MPRKKKTQPSPRYDEYARQRKIGGLENIPMRISERMGCSSGMVYKWDRRFAIDFPEDYARVQSNLSLAMQHAVSTRRRDTSKEDSLRAQIKSLSTQLAQRHGDIACPIPDHVSTIDKGQIGEDLVCYELRRRGFEVHRPWTVTGGTDMFVVSKSDRIIRIEVKSTYSNELCVITKRTFMKDNTWQRRNYDGCKVDFFILVDLIHENVFVAPAQALKAGKTVSLKRNSTAWPWKDAYYLLQEAVDEVDCHQNGAAEGEDRIEPAVASL